MKSRARGWRCEVVNLEGLFLRNLNYILFL